MDFGFSEGRLPLFILYLFILNFVLFTTLPVISIPLLTYSIKLKINFIYRENVSIMLDTLEINSEMIIKQFPI